MKLSFARSLFLGLIPLALYACGGSADDGKDGDDDSSDSSDDGNSTAGRGGDTSGGSGGDGNSGGTPATGGNRPTNPDSPQVISATPENKEAGVAKDANIVVTFNEPMNVASVESAFSLFDGTEKVTNIEFEWNEARTQLTVNPTVDFAYDEVTNLDTPPTTKRFTIGVGAADAEGMTLEYKFEVAFSVLRRVTQTINTTTELTGVVARNDCTTGEAVPPAAPTYSGEAGRPSAGLRGGCDPLAGNPWGRGPRRGFMHFPLSGIRPDAQLESATARFAVTGADASHWAAVGTAYIYRVDYGTARLIDQSPSLLGTMFNTPNLATLATSFTANATKEVDVTELIADRLEVLAEETESEQYVQFKLQGGTSGTGSVAATTRQLIIVYLTP